MPPRIRTRATKALKENIGVKEKSKPKTVAKTPRKVLGDKTNSASDENVSIEVPIKSKKSVTQVVENNVRPRRDRRLPTRYVENKVLANLSNSKDGAKVNSIPVKVITPVKINETTSKTDEPESSPFKTPPKVESSLVSNRPKRICRLPSRFDDHSISSNKYIQINPSNASTPIQQSKAIVNKDDKAKEHENKSKLPTNSNRVDNKPIKHTRLARAAKNAALQKKLSESSTTNKSPDTNNNAKGRTVRGKKAIESPSPKKASPNKITAIKKLRDINLSFKVFEDKKKRDECNTGNLDVYEFTYDPNEEPKSKKKKRKNVTRKRPPKPKTVVFKSNYDQNINKALVALKSAVTKNTLKTAEVVKPTTQVDSTKEATIYATKSKELNIEIPSNTYKLDNTNVNKETSGIVNESGKNSVHEANYPSIRVEDIAADIEPSMDHHEEINYSPVNSPSRPKSPALNTRESLEKPVHVKDPLNLQEDFSFFDDQPVASSSMNMSVRHPLASPWRVEFGSLPIKWPVNTYVKPNMTPAVESSFISSSDSIKRRHVYTNMVPQANDALPEIVTDTTNWRQTSIISFIKEVAERMDKKKRGRSVSPTKCTSLFEDIPKSTNADMQKMTKNTTKKATGNEKITPEENNVDHSKNSNENTEDKENPKKPIKENRKRKNLEAISDKPAKSPRKKKDKDCTYFGFDDSENQGQENVSPIKVKNSEKRTLRSQTRPALQEVNSQTRPMRAALPVAAKTKTVSSSEAVNRVYEDHMSAADAPTFPDKEATPEKDNITNIDDKILNDDDSVSVHLFEDIEVVHHLKPTRKSYGKAKKVTFCQRSMSNDGSASSDKIAQNEWSNEDDLADLTFEVPNVKEKKVTKKKKPKNMRSKKEEREADEWAAGFNSMCEDIEEFPLLVE